MLIGRTADDLKFDLKTQRCFVYKSIKELEHHIKSVLPYELPTTNYEP